MLQAHDWPGNVRELRTDIAAAADPFGGDAEAIITASLLPEEIGSNVPLPVNGGAEHLMSLPLREAREIFEIALRREHGRVRRHGSAASRTSQAARWGELEERTNEPIRSPV